MANELVNSQADYDEHQRRAARLVGAECCVCEECEQWRRSHSKRTTCNTCGRAAASPYRRYDQHGKVIEGCVDSFHSQQLEGMMSESSRWYFRPEAKRIRASNRKAFGWE